MNTRLKERREAWDVVRKLAECIGCKVRPEQEDDTGVTVLALRHGPIAIHIFGEKPDRPMKY